MPAQTEVLLTTASASPLLPDANTGQGRERGELTYLPLARRHLSCGPRIRLTWLTGGCAWEDRQSINEVLVFPFSGEQPQSSHFGPTLRNGHCTSPVWGGREGESTKGNFRFAVVFKKKYRFILLTNCILNCISVSDTLNCLSSLPQK